MKNFLSLDNLEFNSFSSIESFITATSEINDCPITNILQEDKNIWLSEEFLPQEIILNFRNVKLKEHPKKLTAIGIYCFNKYPTNPKIIEVLISKDMDNNFISLGHFDLSFKAGRQLFYLDDDNEKEIKELLNTVDFDNLIIKLIIKETFGGNRTYINNLFLYDNIDKNSISQNNNINTNANINNINMNNNNEINNIKTQYMYNNDNNNVINNIDELNDLESNNNQNPNELLKNHNNLPMNENENENENQEILNNNKININNEKNYEENISPNTEEDNISDYKSKTMIEKFNKKRIKSNRMRENKTPKIFKKYSNQEDRPMTAHSLNNRIINTTVRQYNNKNILDYSNNINNSINNITNSHYNNNININSQNKLNQLINEFRIYKENQESIMNNYETRVKLLEDKCNELKNTMKKMNATMNTIIESQYGQGQASNDYFLKECQNMINEAIVNVLSNMSPYSMPAPPMYSNFPFNIKRNKNVNNLNNNMFFNNYHNIPNGRNNNNIYNQSMNKKGMNLNNMNNINNNFYGENDNENENDNNNEENYMYDDENNMNNEQDNYNDNDNEVEYLAQEIQNIAQDEQFNQNNLNNLNNENNMEYYENENINNNEIIDNNIINNNDNIDNNNINENMNINNINNIDERNNDSKTVKSLHSNDLYNDGLIPYDERIKSNPKKYSNLFAKSTNNYRAKKNNIINKNSNYNNLDNHNNNYENRFNSIYDEKTSKNQSKNKSKQNSNININNSVNQNINEPNIQKNNNKEKGNNSDIKKGKNDEKVNQHLMKNNSKQSIKKIESNNNINKNYGEINKDDSSSSDNSIDNIKINTHITENILKPTLEKFENYMFINNNNNFGKSQSVYSANSFNTKKEIFGESEDKGKLNKGKSQYNNVNDKIKKNNKKKEDKNNK